MSANPKLPLYPSARPTSLFGTGSLFEEVLVCGSGGLHCVTSPAGMKHSRAATRMNTGSMKPVTEGYILSASIEMPRRGKSTGQNINKFMAVRAEGRKGGAVTMKWVQSFPLGLKSSGMREWGWLCNNVTCIL